MSLYYRVFATAVPTVIVISNYPCRVILTAALVTTIATMSVWFQQNFWIFELGLRPQWAGGCR
jgi:hypothetical protein